ncbi:MAG: OmpA family protein [Deltaproteobacteria bacterium]|nr:OmpA family protein [Deltaproteobacteria bacterium]
MIRFTHLTSIALFGVLAIGCGSDPKPEPDTAADLGSASGATNPNDGADANKNKGTPVGIDPRIAELCDLDETRFDFDSASLGAPAESVLNKLAECFVSGKGKDHSINLVGHADERGETEYNVGLGHRRAGAVAKYLDGKGLGGDRVDTSSRGDLEASVGTDERGWAKDRKVEILLRDPADE